MDRLTTKIDATKEKDIHLKTKGVFPPITRQIGNSLADIKSFFDERCQDGVTVVPSECPPHLKHYKDILLHQLKAGSFLFKKNIVTGTEAAQPLLMLMDSLALAMDLEVVARPSDVVCDVLLALCNQPVIVLTLVDGNSNSDMLNEYNTSVAREVTGKLKTFMDERVCVVSGVCCCEDIENPNTFYDTLKEHAQRSSFFIPLKTFETQMPKLNNIVTAIWASVAETNSVKNEDIKRFLTMEQCVILLENINKKEVKVYHKPGSGATTLMLEVARRLSRLNETLLVWNEDVDKKSVLHPSIKTLTELPTSDQRSCANIVVEEDAGEMTQATKHQRCWKFVQLKEDESVPIGEFEYRETKNASREQDREQKIQKQVTRKSITDTDLSKRRSDYVSYEKRIVLVGKTGAGKSATGNTIIGREEFESSPAATFVTTECKQVSLKRFDHWLQIVDAPGFQDTDRSEAETKKRIAECVVKLSPGITAILYTVRIGRFTEEDEECINNFIKTFGHESKNFVIAVFTAADDLTEKYDLQTFIEKSKVTLKRFLKEINNRYIAVNNRAPLEQKEAFVKQLLDKIEQMQRDNGRIYFSCEMLEEAESNLKKIEAKKLKEVEARNRQEHEKMIKEATAPLMAKFAEAKMKEETQAAILEEKMSALKEEEKKREEIMAQRKGDEQAAAFEEMKKKESMVQNKSELDKLRFEREKQEKLYNEKLDDVQKEIDQRNGYVTRLEIRNEVSNSVRFASATITAGTGALIGSAFGPVGALIGGAVGGMLSYF